VAGYLEIVAQCTDIVRGSLPALGQLILEAVEETTNGIILDVRGKHPPRCPSCLDSHVSYHSRYVRKMRDLPWQGKHVAIHLQTRRFRCRNHACDRKIFAEQVPDLAARRARETVRLSEIVGLVGYVLGGLPSERLLLRLGIRSSVDTVLRRVKGRRIGASPPKVRVLSVDDWAWRKRQRYGTMLMDLERSQVIDLLPVRSAESLADWLSSHPEVEVITRDRSSLYADGGRQGARAAVQITDRYHLVSNLGESMERDLQKLMIEARRQLTQTTNHRLQNTKENLTLVEARRQRCRQGRYERYLDVVELHRQGHTQLAIAERVGIRADTVSRWLNAGGFPERQIRSDRRRDQALFVEQKTQGAHVSLVRIHYSAGRVAALLNMQPKSRSAVQTRYLESFLRFCPKARQLRRMALQFRAILRWRNAKGLRAWIDTAIASPFRFLAQFANTLRRDLAAVKLAITKPWSNGPIEGHINRLKTIKRQMYGRAGFQLLKARVLPWEVLNA
jgi:transposase